MMKCVLADANGNVCVTLPVSGQELKFRPAKGRDLCQLEIKLRDLQESGNLSNIEAMITIAAHVCITEGVTVDSLLDAAPGDTMEVAKTVSNFRFISALKP